MFVEDFFLHLTFCCFYTNVYAPVKHVKWIKYCKPVSVCVGRDFGRNAED